MTRRCSEGTRLLLGLTGLAVTGWAVEHDRIGPVEAQAFRAVNRLPDSLYRPAWLVMQGGNLLAVPATAAVAWRADRPQLARRALAGGGLAWLLAKVVKRTYRRPRPAVLVDGVGVRGRAPTGLGYVSGHAAVSTALGLAAMPELSRPGRALAGLALPTIWASRLYVGAHLPLDVLGGIALGVAVDAVVDGVTGCGERGARAVRGGSSVRR